MRSRSAADARGVSEVVGFVLVFSLVIGTITMVYVGGLSGLDGARDAERINNAERAFDVMANNFEQMARGEAPNRATEMKLADAQLTTGSEQDLEINVSSSDDPVLATKTVTIRYDSPGDSNIVYENGAVIRVDDGNAVMRQEPDFLFSEDGNVVVRYIALNGIDQGVGGSSTTVLVRAERRTTSVNSSDTTTDIGIVMETHPDRADVWAEYYEEQIETAAVSGSWGSGDACSVNESYGGPQEALVYCDEFDADSLSVASVEIDVTLT